MMKNLAINIYNDSKKITTHEVITGGNPTVVKADDSAHYEFLDTSTGVAPDHIVTQRDGNNLVVTIGYHQDEGILIIENFYDYPDSALVGLSETGEYYYYTPDTGEVIDYVTQLSESSTLSGHALGGFSVTSPWWMSTNTTGSIDQPVYTSAEHSSGFSYAPWVFLGAVAAVGLAVALNDDDEDEKEPSEPTPALPTPDGNDSQDDSVSIKGLLVNGDTNRGDEISVNVNNHSYTTTLKNDYTYTVNVAKSDLTTEGTDGDDYLSSDTMTGGSGNDVYVVDNVEDTVTENSNEGVDSVMSSIDDYSLPDNVENLFLLGGATIAMGNSLDNQLVGNKLDNTLKGGEGDDLLIGGLGADKLSGGAGSDTFSFRDILDGKIDNITDFTVGEDTIQLSSSVFSSLNADMDNIMEYIHYDAETGNLSYDSDASGSIEAVHFATLSTGLTLTEDSFQII